MGLLGKVSVDSWNLFSTTSKGKESRKCEKD